MIHSLLIFSCTLEHLGLTAVLGIAASPGVHEGRIQVIIPYCLLVCGCIVRSFVHLTDAELATCERSGWLVGDSSLYHKSLGEVLSPYSKKKKRDQF